MGDWLQVQCPYCFEILEIFIERDVEGALVQDCEVCCNPWQLRITRNSWGTSDEAPHITVERL